ncbi:hypothetical protein NEMIN01_1014 [Nematocida minor]|uniref:uncharacterized protein n=1 Tax=Nematocida minor TaxID=1912983 RepID=UPI002220D310|nr:uncharacterized protein NEMIN01_1014 [Nematocida minor]KAI5190390.1 hypothetical protein NEMIN01_1014 [Nematocida minor]
MKEGSELEEKRKTEGQKPTEGSAVIQMQSEAVDKLKGIVTRKYKETTLLIRTVGGAFLETKGWTTEEKPKSKKEQEETVYACDVCSRSFADKRRLAIHKNVHAKAAEQVPATEQ